MKKFSKLALLAAAALAPLAVADAAKADTVTYQTYGTFGNLAFGDTSTNATGFSATNPAPVSSMTTPVGALRLTFTGMPSTTGFSTPSGTAPVGASFALGTFALSGGSSSSAFAGTESFTIHINMTAPATTGTNPQTATATVQGSVTSTGGQSVIFSFLPAVLNFPVPATSTNIAGTESWTFPSFVGVNEVTQPNGATFAATVIGPAPFPTTPLPKTAVAGVGLLGLLGLSKLRSKSAIA